MTFSGVKTYSDPSYIFPGSQDPQARGNYAPASRKQYKVVVENSTKNSLISLKYYTWLCGPHCFFRSVAALEEGSEEWVTKGMRCEEKEPGRAKRKDGKGKGR